MKRSFFYCLVLLFASCDDQSASTGTVIDLFDTEAYLDEIYPSSSNVAHIVKIVSYDGDRQCIENDQYDLNQDLSLLKEININNPNWTDKYLLDTVRTSEMDYQLVYNSVDEKLKIKSMTTMFQGGEIVGFEAHQVRNALISDATKKVRFEKGRGYTISTSSENLISDKRDINIEVLFQNER